MKRAEVSLITFITIALLTVGCDGTYRLFLRQPSLQSRTCDQAEMAVRLEEHKAYGTTYIHTGTSRYNPAAQYVSIMSWATGGAPDAFRLTISCPSTKQVEYDSGLVTVSDDRVHQCSRFYLITLLDPDAARNGREICELLGTGREKSAIVETRF